MDKRKFDRLLSRDCEKLRDMSKDQLVEFSFTIAKCANWFYFRDTNVNKVKKFGLRRIK